jgi:hypothetical protein
MPSQKNESKYIFRTLIYTLNTQIQLIVTGLDLQSLQIM